MFAINLFAFAVVLLGMAGWVMNIIALIGMPLDPITVMLILRFGGVVIPPLGAVLGLFF